MKEPVLAQAPKQIHYIQFGVPSPQAIRQASEVEINQRNLYEAQGRDPVQHGVLDTRLGISNKNDRCATCDQNMSDCVGHWGYIDLCVPVFHFGYFKITQTILQNICKGCSRVMLEEGDRRATLRRLRMPGIDGLQARAAVKGVNERCKKVTYCPYCGDTNGVVKRGGPLKLIHDRFRKRSTEGEQAAFRRTLENATAADAQLKVVAERAFSEELTPQRVLGLFRNISDEDCEVMGLNARSGRPELFLWTSVPVPPVCIRPSVAQDGASNEDDLTVKLSEIVFTNALIAAGMRQGAGTASVMEQWDYLGLAMAMYINSEVPGAPAAVVGKAIRGFSQRLKGKQGRFRGNLSGKRVDFSGRTVISPDPNMRIDEVAVPERVARVLTYPERVTEHNIERLRALVQRGPDTHPGANYVQAAGGGPKRFLIRAVREQTARGLRVGDVVERHLHDGDVVLFNRQPSLHRLSIMAHSARVMPWRTFRFNECVCAPYNADFDGDEMNLHVPQTEEARVEARELLGVTRNLVTPRNGEPIIGATQDFVTTAFLLTQKERFYDRAAFVQLVAACFDADAHVDLPPPCIVKPRCLWSGKQVVGVLLRPRRTDPLCVNIEAPTKSYRRVPVPDLCPRDGFLVIRNSEIMCGILDKAVVGDGKKTSVFFAALHDHGPTAAAALMNRLAKLSARWSANHGFSIGLSDVTPGARLCARKDDLIADAYARCDELIAQSRRGALETLPGCDAAETLENTISGVLSQVRDSAGALCMEELGRYNAPLIMATCGSKGSTSNVCQMVACVGQQIISGCRVRDGFTDRSLPHFPKRSRSPEAKGFVASSFFTGLSPTEFIFHAASGREGLVDAAVKTAETGYMQRRLVKAFEDLRVHYDSSVRNSAGTVVQFEYGGDSLDPYCLEGDARPVLFVHNWRHICNTADPGGNRLAPFQITRVAAAALAEPRFVRWTTAHWRAELSEFLAALAAGLAKLRTAYGLVSYAECPAEAAADAKTGSTARPKARGRRVRAQPSTATDLDISAMSWSLDAADANTPLFARRVVDNKLRVTRPMLDAFLDLCIRKYQRSRVDPGTAVGAIGAQSIGEPTTQMTLKAFHFAGVASMNVSMGVPRIKEIINAAKKISTPVVSCALLNNNVSSARIVKGRIERTLLGEIARCIEEVYSATACYLSVEIDMEVINLLQLELSMAAIREAIANAPKLKIGSNVHIRGTNCLDVFVSPKDPSQLYYALQTLKRALPLIVVHGVPEAHRSAILQSEDGSGQLSLSVEGYSLREAMTTDGIDGRHTFSNHIMDNLRFLGIEAARTMTIRELSSIFDKYGIGLDIRHLMLLGDLMSYKGEILGITRYGIAKMNDSVMMLASFEKTTDHLFDAAVFGKRDMVHGVSERIIMGQQMPVGTGVFKLLMDYDRDVPPTPRKLLFDESSSRKAVATI